MYSSTFERVLITAIKIGVWVILFLPLYISSSLLFPFITGKNFAFRIITEVIFTLYLGAAIMWPQYRPRLTPLFKAVTVFILVLFLADLFGLNPYRSFFSNFERMEGFMMLFHMYLYFLLLSSIFRKKDWIIFFHLTLAASIIVSLVGMLQRLGFSVSLQGGFRVDSTIGNPTYLAAYLLFHLWVLGLLFYKFWNKIWLKVLYSAIFIFELSILYFTATRGAVLALLAGSLLFLLGLVIFWKKIFPEAAHNRGTPSRGRIIAVSFFLLVIIVPVFLWGIRKSGFVQSTNVLLRLTNYSLSERTIQSRFNIWNMSFRGVLDRPILGWGQENYYLVFQKYYEPKLYSSEPWFDRSHNIFLDWLVHAGFLGLFSFLSIFVVLGWQLILGIRRARALWLEGMILGGLFLTYFLQNIFVFDNMNTYILLFGFWAYSNFLTSREETQGPSRQPLNKPGSKMKSGIVFMAASLILVTWAGYFLHIKPVMQGQSLIHALQVNQSRGITMDQRIAVFQEALAYNTFGNTEVREQMANTARNVLGDSDYTSEQKKVLIELVREEFKKEILNPENRDIKHMLFLASVIDRAASINPQYLLEAEYLLQDAISIAPNKQILYFELAQVYLSQNKREEAINILKKAMDLDPSFQQAVVNVLIVSQLAGKGDIFLEAKKYFKAGGLDENTLQRVGAVFQQAQDFVAAKEIFSKLVSLYPEKPQYHATLSALLGHLGEVEKAIEEARAAAALDPEFAREAEIFINQLKQKKK